MLNSNDNAAIKKDAKIISSAIVIGGIAAFCYKNRKTIMEFGKKIPKFTTDIIKSIKRN